MSNAGMYCVNCRVAGIVIFNAIIAAALGTDSNTHSHYPGSNLWAKAAT
jgi:hypothetical protein